MKKNSVGAGYADPCAIIWLAVENFEASKTLLRILLQHPPLNTHHHQSILQSILPGNTGGARFLLDAGACTLKPLKAPFIMQQFLIIDNGDNR